MIGTFRLPSIRELCLFFQYHSMRTDPKNNELQARLYSLLPWLFRAPSNFQFFFFRFFFLFQFVQNQYKLFIHLQFFSLYIYVSKQFLLLSLVFVWNVIHAHAHAFCYFICCFFQFVFEIKIPKPIHLMEMKLIECTGVEIVPFVFGKSHTKNLDLRFDRFSSHHFTFFFAFALALAVLYAIIIWTCRSVNWWKYTICTRNRICTHITVIWLRLRDCSHLEHLENW